MRAAAQSLFCSSVLHFLSRHPVRRGMDWLRLRRHRWTWLIHSPPSRSQTHEGNALELATLGIETADLPPSNSFFDGEVEQSQRIEHNLFLLRIQQTDHLMKRLLRRTSEAQLQPSHRSQFPFLKNSRTSARSYESA